MQDRGNIPSLVLGAARRSPLRSQTHSHPSDPVNLTGSDLSVKVAVTSLYYNDVTARDDTENAIDNMETKPAYMAVGGRNLGDPLSSHVSGHMLTLK